MTTSESLSNIVSMSIYPNILFCTFFTRLLVLRSRYLLFFFFFQAEDGIRDYKVTGVQTCALPILEKRRLEEDMRVAAQIQRGLLPESAPIVPGYGVVGFNQPCRTVGGDYYDFEIGRASCRERV